MLLILEKKWFAISNSCIFVILLDFLKLKWLKYSKFVYPFPLAPTPPPNPLPNNRIYYAMLGQVRLSLEQVSSTWLRHCRYEPCRGST